ncbi:tetratricopeptide repeat-containing sulfotransferase family protein [Yoonia tamlensis]|uniref:tetratricopeptide repeat-containing sulfotransferase family protein n=1 Tax=Yoonia tamlensis TaxID=390270 RepID=UPI001042427E|nr:tetratricopeptide repeat-containing sulfotransferase family protein [Yoonia tamlensis]
MANKLNKVATLGHAMALAKAGRTADAGQMYEQLLAQKPQNIVVLSAVISFHNRYSMRFRRALPMLQLLLKLRPKAASSHALAAETMCNCARLASASQHAQTALALAPDDPDVLFIAAHVAMAQREYDTALGHLTHALEIRPGHRQSMLQSARALVATGELATAQSLCRDLLQANPDDMNVIGLYIHATRIKSDDPIFVYLRDVILPATEKIGGMHLSNVVKQLAKASNDFGDYDGAFNLFARAKAVLPMQYDAKHYANFVSTQCTNISRADYFARGSQSDAPVLIVGMPRSGSTLLEQVLASHGQIGSAGESPSLNVIVQDTKARSHNGEDLVRAIKQIPDGAAQKMAARYLAETAQTGALRTLDKSLHNFELLGFFAVLFPRARIIHMRRDPLDTCVSCYMQNLSAWHKYTQDLDSLGHAYMQYDRLMAHWEKVLPNPILQVNYEDVVRDIETQGRRAVDFLGLDWDPACLEYQTSKNRVQTLSAGQVREPLYTSSMRRWQRYDAHLAPLKAQLKPLYPDGFDAPASRSGRV